MDSIRFHLDESCHPGLSRALRPRGIDATTTQEVGLLGAPDEEQLGHAHAEGRTLFTHDGDFVGIHEAGTDHSGIIYCHQRRHPFGEIIRRLVLIWEFYTPEEMRDRLEYL